jgi:hypothetical protein
MPCSLYHANVEAVKTFANWIGFSMDSAQIRHLREKKENSGVVSNFHELVYSQFSRDTIILSFRLRPSALRQLAWKFLPDGSLNLTCTTLLGGFANPGSLRVTLLFETEIICSFASCSGIRTH